MYVWVEPGARRALGTSRITLIMIIAIPSPTFFRALRWGLNVVAS
jgi:hypothetical protein